ncbi:type II secretion system minor pseudopilin GspK [Pleionea sp. CnH1-48]|uniref:type II secretion system minor pseudopilin GspK n=1 Tax=Pleionea sp. CnH1-48 TaxID=2954494 RepID=UPI002096E896|nr:type II secretion system minor pseudopilin GspK [Pleionea sp. CnH1-48]MCO7225197.1 type II secretion system minor pseudopilin GspK [Pleionea sp. CnH1-48]
MKKNHTGATLIIVLVVVALATFIATQLIELTSYGQRRTELTLARDQVFQLALGGEELAKQWMTKGFGKEVDKVHLNQPWATTPLEFPIEGGKISATIEDATACFNLNTLHSRSQEVRPLGAPAPAPQPSPRQGGSRGAEDSKKDPAQAIFVDLMQSILTDVEVQPEALAAAVIDWIDSDFEPYGPDGAEDLEYTSYDFPYRTANNWMANKSELMVIKGFNADTYKTVKDYVCVLPGAELNQVNVNTISTEKAPLLKALIGGDLSESDAQEILTNRPEDGFDESSFWEQVKNSKKVSSKRKQRITFKSDYFLVRMEVTYKGATLKMGSLLQRGAKKGAPFEVVTRYFGEY